MSEEDLGESFGSRVRRTIVEFVACRTGQPVESIDLNESLWDVGLSSLEAVELAGELESICGRGLEASLTLEAASIEALVARLAVGGKSEAPASGIQLRGGEGRVGVGENFSLAALASDASHPGLRARTRSFLEASGNQRGRYRRMALGASGRRVLVRTGVDQQERALLMFGSNNYLGLADDPQVKEAVVRAMDTYGVGMGGPPLFNGYSILHAKLEERLASLKGAESALLFASGFGANLGLAGALFSRGRDLIVHDELVHASFLDGLAHTGARSRSFAHNDVAALRRVLENATQEGDIYVAVEGVYSMDGDVAPLAQIAELTRRHGAFLIVDDAHGTGVLGQHGRGTAAHLGVEGQVDFTMGTFSKSFGLTGGFVAADRDLVEYMRYFARSYMFSASLPPIVVAGVLAGLDVLEREPERQVRLHERVNLLVRTLNGAGIPAQTDSAIVAVKIPVWLDVPWACRELEQQGIFLNCVEYPAVPLTEQRFRISVMCDHTTADILELCAALEHVWKAGALAASGEKRA